MRNRRSSRLNKIIPSIIFLLFFTFSFGQDSPQNKQLPLKEILAGIEQRFEVRFSYLDRDLDSIQLLPPPASLGLERSLDDLRSKTNLHFERISSRYIAVKKKDLQAVCLLLLDRSTEQPLPSATVWIGDTATAVTDSSGKFQLKEFLSDTSIRITHLGYAPIILRDFSFPERDCKTIYMDAIAEDLQEMLVVNYLTSGISKDEDGSIKIDTERFGVLPGLMEPDVLQTLEALPGVESVNETISNINIRGGTSDQNLVLFDGIKMYLTGHFFGLISAFNSNLTKKATLIKNGTESSLNEGVSGTLDIRSQNELTGKFSAGAGVSLVSGDAYFRVPITEKLEVHFSGRRSLNDFFNTPTYNSYFDRTFQDTEIQLPGREDEVNDRTADFNYYDFSFKALYDLSDRHKLRLSTLYIDNNLNYQELSSNDLAEEKKKSSLAQRNLATGGSWSAHWSNNFHTETLAYLTRYELDAANLNIDAAQQLLQRNEVLETGFKINAINKLNQQLKLTNGYHFYEVGVLNAENLNNPFFSSRIKNVIRSHSAFSELSYEGGRIFLMTGLRYNYFDKFEKFLIEPRLSFNYKIKPGINYKVQGEFKSQITSQSIDLQEDFLGVENRRWILADNENFPVIQSRQVSTGIDFRAGGWYIDLEGYYKQVEGISTSNQGFQDQNEFRRVAGNYTARGVELLVNKKYRNFHTYFTYTLAESDYNFEALEPQQFPNNFDIPHSASLAVNYHYEDLKFSIGGKWRSGRPYTSPVEENQTRREGNTIVVNYDDPNSSRLPYFFRLDASSSYTFSMSGEVQAHISLGFLNILNRANIINSYFRVDEEDNSRAVRIDNASLRFTPNALFRIDF
ncbi:TonB-dependent receptor [Salegentibacter sp. JZCK2]|uniref:TonB-dependent receptor n=1 Tax=Salegentibacter tibetensis TaxID=2873600 RepID=UPI001CC9A506|nr:TonB-dependent receptor plug domain-containing protein [Salegentibacter tibetensis]MBZ9728777.1 TonB-dependent receptor [Salegentibacter tibetensis]